MDSDPFTTLKYPTPGILLRQPDVQSSFLSIIDENVLLEECKKQNRNAQKMLYETYFNKMMPVCLRYLRNEDDALDVLNMAFLKIFTKINQFKSEGTLASWIKRIVINTAIDFVRSNKSYKTKFIHTSDFRDYGEPGEKDDSGYGTYDLALNFSKEELLEMVKELPQATRVVFNLFVIDEFTHEQISKNLRISTGTSKWHMSNARRILKEKISNAIASKNDTTNHGHETEWHR